MSDIEPRFPRATVRIDGIGRGSDRRIVSIGRVEVRADAADPQVFEQNVREGQEALKRAVQRLSVAGVRFQKRRGVASYRADPKNPDRVIRELLGKTEIGVFENGEFKAIR